MLTFFSLVQTQMMIYTPNLAQTRYTLRTVFQVPRYLIPAGTGNCNPAAFNDGPNTPTSWPFVQLYDIDGEDGETLTVAYGSDTIDVTFNDDDLSDSASVAFDRSGAPAGAVVHLTITDPRLNLDPTGDDTWTLTVNDDTNDPNTATQQPPN